MAFPFWIRNELKFKIDDIGASSERYLINHIEQRLKDIGMVIYNKKDNSLIYHKGCLSHFWRRKDFIDNGSIKVVTSKNEVKVILESLTIGMFFFSLLFGAFLLLDDITVPRWKGAIIVFSFFFGFNFIIRYFAQKTLKDEIKELLLNL